MGYSIVLREGGWDVSINNVVISFGMVNNILECGANDGYIV